jgi:long-chain-fatty-acid--[acyl-carrier-protein] ligase
VILFTSGSESLPKAVPLSHANLLSNLRDVLQTIQIRRDDSMLGMLPPFHSFGLTITMLAPLCAGLRVVHYPNPTEGPVLARLTARWRPSMVLGTPTFLAGIARAAGAGELASVRLAVTGAEKCSEQVYALVAERCPGAKIIEGYGITECSPIVSANNDVAPQPFTIGRVLPSLRHVIVNEDTGKPVLPGEAGMLLVSGPSVFAGYLGQEGNGPFVESDGARWYRTGDLVAERADGCLVFKGRRKRFVKLGGEMVSLPAIEEVLVAAFSPPDQDEPCLALETAGDDGAPELVLFTTLELDRATVNDRIRGAGLSGLHNIRRVVRVQAIPVLGTGKTDYRALRTQLAAVA